MNHFIRVNSFIFFVILGVQCLGQSKQTYTISAKTQAHGYIEGFEEKVAEQYVRLRSTENPNEKAAMWNPQEVEKYGLYYFDYTGNLYQGIPASKFTENFSVYILDILKQENGKYQIDALIHSLNKKSTPSAVWCIHSLNFTIVNDSIIFENKIGNITSDWHSLESKYLTYHFSNNSDYPDAQTIDLNDKFIQNLIGIFVYDSELPKKKFDYYYASSTNELGRLLNYEYFFVGYTDGITTPNESIISSNGFNHFHEIVHLFLPASSNRGFIIEEGLASFLGTKKAEMPRYNQRLIDLNEFLLDNSLSLSNIVQSGDLNTLHGSPYAFGALICELIYNKKGNAGLSKLALAQTSTDLELTNAVKEITGSTLKEIAIDLEILLKELVSAN